MIDKKLSKLANPSNSIDQHEFRLTSGKVDGVFFRNLLKPSLGQEPHIFVNKTARDRKEYLSNTRNALDPYKTVSPTD